MTDDASARGGAGASGRRLTPKDGKVTKIGERAVELGRGGFSRAEIAADLGCSCEELARWEAKYPTLAAALGWARDLELAWWEARGREGIDGGKLNATLWSKAMAGRFAAEGYGERSSPSADRRAGPGRRRPLSHRERAKAVRLLIAESGARPALDPDISEDTKGEPR